jgi:ketol-acid reductoisomerase
LEAQYEVLRKNGHSPSEAFNETVEEFTQSLVPLMAAKGVDWLIANCSTTAQRGALDWAPKFKKAVLPTFKELYKSVRTGKEAERTIKLNSKSDYRAGLEKELKKVRSHEMWRTGEVVRSLRPENQ